MACNCLSASVRSSSLYPSETHCHSVIFCFSLLHFLCKILFLAKYFLERNRFLVLNLKPSAAIFFLNFVSAMTSEFCESFCVDFCSLGLFRIRANYVKFPLCCFTYRFVLVSVTHVRIFMCWLKSFDLINDGVISFSSSNPYILLNEFLFLVFAPYEFHEVVEHIFLDHRGLIPNFSISVK